MNILLKLKKSLESILIFAGIIMILSKISGILPCILLSGSMEPELKTGSVIFVNTNEKHPAVGEVITYQIENQKVTHRVIGSSQGNYITKGDANPTSDANPVAASQIVGKVVCAIPFLGYVISAIQSKTGIFLLVLFLIISLFSDILSEFKSQTKFQSIEKTGKESAFKTHKK